MRKTITKQNVIKALKTEKLDRGEFFETYSTSLKCRVCAVGAILRHMSFEKWAKRLKLSLSELGFKAVKDCCVPSDINTRAALEDENYLGALSVYFEAGHTQRQCIQFVKKHFPKKLTLAMNKGDFSE